MKTFDWRYYISQYPDLRELHIDNELKAWKHYNSKGRYEQRKRFPLDLFNWKFYLKQYPDLIKAGINTEMRAKNHYSRFGVYENRITHNICLPPRKNDTMNNNKTTIVFMGYNTIRINKNIKVIINNYDNLSKYINKLIFIWNNQKEPIPTFNYPKMIEFCIIKATKNSLCNRHFIIYDKVDTESVIIVDDDVILDEKNIIDLIDNWQKNKDMVIGLVGRSFDKFGNYYLLPNKENIITLGQTMMYHKKYMLEFAKHKTIHDFIDNKDPSKSDDIAIQLMIQSINNHPSTKVIYSNTLVNLDSSGAISNQCSRMKYRSDAIRFYIKYFKLNILN